MCTDRVKLGDSRASSCADPWQAALVFVLASVFAGGCTKSSAAHSEAASRTPTSPNGAVALPRPSGELVYVSDETGGSLAVIDVAAGQVAGRLPVGKRPRAIRLSRDGARLFVALSGSPIGGPGVDQSKLPPADRAADGIGVVDLATGTLTQKIQSGQDPEAFDLSRDGNTLFVSNEETAELSVVDLASGSVKAHIKVGEEPEGVSVRPDGRLVYVTCEAENEVVAIDTSTLRVVARMPTAPRPRAVAFTGDGRTAFVTDENGNSVTVIDARRHKVSTTIKIPQTSNAPTPPRPMGAILSPDSREVFVSLGRARSIAVLDVPGRKLIRTIENVGIRPWGIGISTDGRKLFTANGPSGDVSIVDVETGKVDKRIVVGGSPWGIAVAPRR